MSQSSSDKYLYFTVGLLKDSTALDALRQDAIKHHMVDQPGQLIALRLTEYYDMMNRGIVQPVIRVPAVAMPANAESIASANGDRGERVANTPPMVSQPMPTIPPTPRPATMPQTVDNMPSSTSNQQATGKTQAVRRDEERIMFVSPAADQNADEAADYWSTL